MYEIVHDDDIDEVPQTVHHTAKNAVFLSLFWMKDEEIRRKCTK